MKNIAKGLLALIVTLLLASCGGGGSGGLVGQNPLVVTVTAGNLTLPTNVLQTLPCEPGQCAFTTSVIVTVTRPDGTAVPNGTEVQLATDNVAVGTLSILDDPATTNVNEFQLRMGTVPTQTASGQAQFFFTSSVTGGVATLTASVKNEADGKYVTATIQITVVDTTGPISTLAFTGPYAEAIVTGQFALGDTTLQDGTYARVLSAVAKDASGNPPKVGTPIYFRLIDAPLTGYPASGPGSFTITGTNGNPAEGGYLFTAAGGNFQGKGARVGDMLVLHPDPDSGNFFHEGARFIASFNAADSLNITTGIGPFAAGGDTGATVPYTIGRAQYGNILATAFTDLTGTASTIVTYPVSRIGQTAILVAHTADGSVSTVLNTGRAVYLANLGESGLLLTASTTTLAFNSGGSGTVTLCLTDTNLVPLPNQTITASVTTLAGGASVTVTPSPLVTGADGCVTATVGGTYVIADTGSSTNKVSFNTQNAAAAVEVTVTINDVTP